MRPRVREGDEIITARPFYHAAAPRTQRVLALTGASPPFSFVQMGRRLLVLMTLVTAACGVAGSWGCATGASGTTPGDDDAQTGDDASPGDDGSAPTSDAGPPDAQLAPSAISMLTPSSLVLPRGASAAVTVELDQPALGGGAVVLLASPDDPGGAVVAIPTQVTVPAGQSSASFTVMAMGQGGPIDIHATFEASEVTSSVQVVPALVSLTPGNADVVVGTTVTYTVTLEGPAAALVVVNLSSSSTAVATTPPTVPIPMGASSATFGVTGVALGGPVAVTAAIGPASVSASARVVGLYLSEALYDVSGTDTTKEWVELWNGAPVAIDITGMKLGVANTAGAYVDALTLAGSVAPGQCIVVGGPLVGAAASNFTPEGFAYFVTGDFNPDLGNAGSVAADPGDGLSLVTATGDVVDNVLYGRNNNDLITDENGAAPGMCDVTDVATGHSIERTAPGLAGPWVDQVAPTPGNCTPVSL